MIILIIVAIVVVLVIGVLSNLFKQANGGISYTKQRKMDIESWNDGKCHNCGYHWTLYEYDEILGRVYVCTRCHKMTDVITDVDKHYYTCEDPDHPDYIE